MRQRPLAIAIGLLLTLNTARAEERRFQFDLKAQKLSAALKAVASEVNVKLRYADGLLRDQSAPALHGRYSLREALDQLLGGAGLSYTVSPPGIVTIKMPANTTLAPLTVTAKPTPGSLTTPSILQTQAKLDRVPGGTTLIDGERLKEGVRFSASDALAYAPGVYVGDANAGVGGGTRISIRGSDVNSIISPIRGIMLLRNGLPFTSANGLSDTESINIYPADHIEVYRGANALEYGASTLGGAINFVNHTGYTSSGVKAGITAGSYGYLNPRISAGHAFDSGWDAYGSFSYIDFDGNRQNNDQDHYYGYGTLGYRWNEHHESRLHIDLQDHEYLIPSPLTKQQLEENPRQHTGSFDNPHSGFPVYRVDLQHSVRMNDGDRLDFGAYYFKKDFSFLFTEFGFFRDLWEDAGLSWRHQINGQLLGMKNRIVWGGLAQWMRIKDRNFGVTDGERGPLLSEERDKWQNFQVYLEDQLDLTDTFTLVLGIQAFYREVEYEDLMPDPGDPKTAGQEFSKVNPKLGFIWRATPAVQIYGNVSRSAEPPPLNNLSSVSSEPQLKTQTGTTVEIGTRGRTKWLRWDLAFYQAWLDNEFLITPTPPRFTDFSAANADDTLHTGVELGLESTLPLGLLADYDQIRIRGSYSWNHFRFDDDPVLGDNQLPGIPEHNARVELLYQHPSGFYIGPNVQVASKNFVDFTNTLAANSYALLGARIGWDNGKNLKVFVDGRNLTDEHYAASVFVTGDAGGQDRASFNPGPTRMIFGGVEIAF
ncbi:TonB-dependent receptor domain-containing protein [Nitrococcus mobilis]|uniref:TonB-dependent receptor protein n=1 Tax=Nitrococcus mobilis Nb-231 TaxID=314278 RepID=A4BVH0_9GAMM|nr:TonB-dependent receptor [Nitrococcus mobilis]EAR20290.1 TonB-dependent receptor protein [Nitrococcus mobilis Nb-231]